MASKPPIFTPQTGAAGPRIRAAQTSNVDISTVQYLIDASSRVVTAELKAHVQTELQNALTPIHNELKDLRDLPKTKTLVLTVVGTGASLFLGILAVLSFSGDRFDGGMSASSALSQQALEQSKTINEINRKLESISGLSDKSLSQASGVEK